MKSSSALVCRLTRLGRARGFTLIEVMVVVIIIAVLAVIAIPSITFQLRDRRTKQAAEYVASMYTEARMRAIGRGAAVLVRYDRTLIPTGQVDMREAIRIPTAAPECSAVPPPVSSCLLPALWNAPQPPPAMTNRVLRSFNPSGRPEYAGVQIAMEGPPGQGAVNQMDVCFTPMGSTYVRYDTTGPFTRLTGVPQATVWRQDPDGSRRGLTRIVTILPNGVSHLGTSAAVQ